MQLYSKTMSTPEGKKFWKPKYVILSLQYSTCSIPRIYNKAEIGFFYSPRDFASEKRKDDSYFCFTYIQIIMCVSFYIILVIPIIIVIPISHLPPLPSSFQSTELGRAF